MKYKVSKTTSIITAIGLSSILSSCKIKESYDFTHNVYIPSYYTNQEVNTNGYDKGYSIENNGYRMKILSLSNNDNVVNIIGYFTVSKSVLFQDIVNNEYYDLTNIVNDNNTKLYISDISDYIEIDNKGVGLNDRIVNSLFKQINNDTYIEKYSDELQECNKLIIKDSEVIISEITDYIKNYRSNTNTQNIVKDIATKR